MKKINNTCDYFCSGSHTTSGRPKMEAELFEYAKKLLLHHIVAGTDMGRVANELKLREECLKQLHPQWKPVSYYFTGGEGGTAWLVIGAGHLVFQQILGEF